MSEFNTALVTGAGSGIGRAIAQDLAQGGYEVLVTGRRESMLQDTARQIADAGGKAKVRILDVSDTAAVAGLPNLLCGSRLDVAVINAGTLVRGAIAELPDDGWQTQIDVNLSGAFYCLRESVRIMQCQQKLAGSRGHIFTINSGAGVRGYAAGVGYAASKHGLRGLVESARLEVAPLAIKLTDIVVAAAVESAMNADLTVSKLPAAVVAQTLRSCLALTGGANWDRVDLSQVGSP